MKIIGTDCDAIERAEDRKVFEEVLTSLDIPQPRGEAVTSVEDSSWREMPRCRYCGRTKMPSR